MESQKRIIGKIAMTAEGRWNKDKEYPILSIVEDGNFASYLSRKPVPKNIELTNTEYWQPFASLKESIKLDYQNFKNEIINSVEDKINDYITSDAFNILLEAKIRKIITNINANG